MIPSHAACDTPVRDKQSRVKSDHDYNHVLTTSPSASVLHSFSRMGIRMQERDREVFVMVNYDFEYITEEGKEVWMKEGEILLLLSRTNNDWWQVCPCPEYINA